MALSLILLCVAAAAIISIAVSALVAVGLVAGRRALASRSPAAQARVLLALALLPALVTIVALVAALAPSFGWIADHCVAAPDPHTHPHICAHHESLLPAVPIVALAILFALRLAIAVARGAALWGSAARARRALMREADGDAAKPDEPHVSPPVLPHVRTHVLPINEPQAFVLGVARPSLFVTRGLLAPENREHMRAVLAHERAHLQRRDPARRLAARVASGFHLPGIARAIERQLARAHERAADEAAADAIGDRAVVARALVHLARARAQLPHAALAFAGSDVELRIRALLDPDLGRNEPRPRTLAAVAAIAAVAILGGADAVHHGIEIALGLLAS